MHKVVDARDPLFYRSTDLESYARALHPSKATVLLLNKSDLLSEQQRQSWAEYFSENGIKYLFWSAHAATAAAETGSEDGCGTGTGPETLVPEGGDEKGEASFKVLTVAELIARLEAEALEAVMVSGQSFCAIDSPGCDMLGNCHWPSSGLPAFADLPSFLVSQLFDQLQVQLRMFCSSVIPL